MRWKKGDVSFFKSMLSELFADFGSVKVFMRSQQCDADPAVPQHRPHTRVLRQNLGFL